LRSAGRWCEPESDYARVAPGRADVGFADARARRRAYLHWWTVVARLREEPRPGRPALRPRRAGHGAPGFGDIRRGERVQRAVFLGLAPARHRFGRPQRALSTRIQSYDGDVRRQRHGPS